MTDQMTDMMKHHEAERQRAQGFINRPMQLGNAPLVPPSFRAEIQTQYERLALINEQNLEAMEAYKKLFAILESHPEVADALERVHVLTRYPR